MKNRNTKITGLIMAIIGFVMIVINVWNYIFSSGTAPTLGIIGLVLVAIGMRTVRQTRQST